MGKSHKWRAASLKKTEKLWIAIRQCLEDINNAFLSLAENIEQTKNILLMCCAANARIIAENSTKLLAFKYGLEDDNVAAAPSSPLFGTRGRGVRGAARGSRGDRARGSPSLRYRGRGSLQALRGVASSRGSGGRGEFNGRGLERGSRGERGTTPRGGSRGGGRGGGEKHEHAAAVDPSRKTLSQRVDALRGLVDVRVYNSLQTIRLIGNKTVHPSVFKATLIDISAVVASLHKLVSACIAPATKL